MSDSKDLIDPALRTVLEDAMTHDCASPCLIDQVTRVGGGSIAEAIVVRAGDRRCFVKLGAADRDPMFAAEADGLAALAACPALRVPRLVARGVCRAQAYLLLEHIDLHALHRQGAGAIDNAARALVELHRTEGSAFGWPHDNFIGSTPQANAWHAEWSDFFAAERLLPQLALARRERAARRLVAGGERLIDTVPALLAGYRPAASLVHGDLWSGNAALDGAARLVLFDPAVHYGDREADLAMCALFGGFPERFFAAYGEAWPLATGWQARRMLYQLYHLLNHFNLFGGGYLDQCAQTVARLLAETG